MQHERVYLDYNAGAPLLDCARSAMVKALEQPGNASAIYHEGRGARREVETARRALAELIGATPAQIVFTSGASEAANMMLSPVLRRGGKPLPVSALYLSAIEHPCVLEGGRFPAEKGHSIPVTETGVVDLTALEAMLDAHDIDMGAPMVAVMLANNETGIIQPIARIAELVHAQGGFLCVDAVQALGRIPIDVTELGADFLIFSGHKIGAPQGSGALVLADAQLTPPPLIKGGGQENFLRAGTENVAAIAGFGAACEWHLENMTKKVQISETRDYIEAGIAEISLETGNQVAQPVVFGKGEARLANTSCFSVAGIRAETALVALDLAGISASSGSACSSGKVRKSHVLAAMNVDETLMEGALRLSLGWDSGRDQAKRFLEAWQQIVGRLAA